MSSFDGEDYDGFIRSKAGKKRRKRKKELRSQGLSRKEARQQAVAEIPTSKKGREELAYQTAEAQSYEEMPIEVQDMADEGLVSSNPQKASLQIAEAVGGIRGMNRNPKRAIGKLQDSMGNQVSMAMSDVVDATKPLVEVPLDMGMSMIDEVVDVIEGEGGDDSKIFGLPKMLVYAGAVAVAGYFILPKLMGK